MLALLLLVACGEVPAPQGADGEGGRFGPDEIPTESSAPPTSSTTDATTGAGWVGWEDVRESTADTPGAAWSCSYVWQTTGVPVTATDCPDCVFVFDVTFTFDDWEYSHDDGTCGHTTGDDLGETLNQQARLALVTDYLGYGPWLMVAEAGAYVGLAPATYKGGRLFYADGARDVYVGGLYTSYYRAGEAEIDR